MTAARNGAASVTRQRSPDGLAGAGTSEPSVLLSNDRSTVRVRVEIAEKDARAEKGLMDRSR